MVPRSPSEFPDLRAVFQNYAANLVDCFYDEADEPHQTLFTWAEFMAAEPVNPKGRKSKPLDVRVGD